MKKLFLVFISVFIILTCLVGCNSTTISLYKSVVADAANDGIGVPTECAYWTGGYSNKANKYGETRTISYNGVQYTGKYEYSIVEKLDSYATDHYIDESFIEFGLNSDTGKLVYLNLMNNTFFDTEPYLDEVSNPEETAIAVAERVASEFVTDISAYERIIETPKVRYKERDGQTYRISYHTITFAKKINGFYTSDYISIKVTSKGNLASIKAGDLDAFSSTPIEIDRKVLENSISEKVSTVYTEISHRIVETSSKDQKLAMTPDGQICVYSNIAVRLEDPNAKAVDTGISILTVIG